MLRKYQDDALSAIVSGFRSGVSRQIVALPTGTGKALLFANLPTAIGLHPGERMLVLVHRQELLFQAVDKIRHYSPGLSVGIEKAEYTQDNADVVVACVQSMNAKRLSRINPEPFRYICADESHHFVAPMFKRVLDHFRVLKSSSKNDPSKLLVGFSATPQRGDGKGLDSVFDSIVYSKDILSMVQEGWLAEPHGWLVKTEASIADVSIRQGDLAVEELSVAVDTPERNRLIVEKYLQLGGGASGVAFTVSIQHSINLAKMFESLGISAVAVYGDMPDKLRRQAIADHASGTVKILTSCSVLQEGWDNPRATVALMARPTRSAALYAQEIGRVLRPCPSPEDLEAMNASGRCPDFIKNFAVVIDFADLSSKHQGALCRLPSLLGMNGDFNLAGRSAIKTKKRLEQLELENPGFTADEATELHDVPRLLRAFQERIDLFQSPLGADELRGISRMTWQKSRSGFFLPIPSLRATIQVSQNLVNQWEIHQSSSGQRSLLGSFSDLTEAIRHADAAVPPADYALTTSGLRWHIAVPTRKQTDLLWKLSEASHKGYRDAAQMHRAFCKLSRQGYKRYSRGGLSQILDALLSKHRRSA